MPTYGVGIDCHSRFIMVDVLARQGDTIARWERRYSTTWEELCEAREWMLAILSQALGERAPRGETVEYTLESTAAYHYPVMLAWSANPCVVNPLIANPSRRKTDKLDAKMLATQAMMGMWPRSVIPTREQESCRLVMQHRLRLVRERTRITNQMNNMVLRHGHTFAAHLADERRGTLSAPHILPVFEALIERKLPNVKGISPFRLPENVCASMKEMVDRVNWLNNAVNRAARAALRAVEKTEFVCHGGELVMGDKLIAHLITVPGVRELLATAWLTQVLDATRFKHAGQVQAFCGFDPSLMVSAGKTTSHTRRKGNKWLHYLIKQCAGNLLKARREPLGAWGHGIRLRNKRGGYNRACGAVGRRIATGLWVCHRDQVNWTYDRYQFWRAPEVPDVSIEELGLPDRVAGVLRSHGYTRSVALAKAFYEGELAGKKGVGPSCLVQVRRWIESHRASSSVGR